MRDPNRTEPLLGKPHLFWSVQTPEADDRRSMTELILLLFSGTNAGLRRFRKILISFHSFRFFFFFWSLTHTIQIVNESIGVLLDDIR